MNEDFYTVRDKIAHEMAASVRDGLESVYGQLISFSLINVTLPLTIDASLIDQQINKRKVETATERQQIQQIQGQIENIKNQAEVSEANILAEGNAYYDSTVQSAASGINKEKYTAELDNVANVTHGVYGYFFTPDTVKFNKFCWYKKVCTTRANNIAA